MLIDPSGKNIEINVETWSSNTVTNEFISNTDLSGYTRSKYMGSTRKFKCNGTIYKDCVITDNYLKAISFDDIIEISIDIRTDACVIDDIETVEGYISILSYTSKQEGIDVYSYSMEGFFFTPDEYELLTIGSYFNLGPVSKSGNGAQNSSLTASVQNTTWGSGGIVIATLGGPTFTFKAYDLADCSPQINEIDSGDNVFKAQIMTYSPDNELLDISYFIVTRGGFKLESGLRWLISISGVNEAYYSSITGPKKITTAGLTGSSITCIGTGVSILTNNTDFNVISPVSEILTEIIPGNVFTIVSSSANCISGISSGSSLPPKNNCEIIGPTGGETYFIQNNRVLIPIDFSINDASRITSITAQLCSNYQPNWSFNSFTNQSNSDNTPTTIDLKYKYGGRIVCGFQQSSRIKIAGVRLLITYSGWSEITYCPATFSVGLPGDATNGIACPIAGYIEKYTAMSSYPIFQTSDMIHGIYDLYFTFTVASGICCVDMGLYINSLGSGFLDSTIIDSWGTILDNIFVKSSPASIPTMPSYDQYHSIDFGGGGLNMRMIGDTGDPSGPSSFTFRRTVFIDPSAGSHVHAIVRNIGSGQLTGFTVKAVPLFSYNINYKFVGDCSIANAPNVKNAILVPR